MDSSTRYILSVDVEDYFQVEAFTADVPRADWDRWPSRVVANTHRCLDLCDEFGVRATYFTLGWVARKFPELVREIHARGHELACHSFWHRPVYSLTPEEFRDDLRQARDTIEQTAGVQLLGYRAPSWSITAKSIWALDILAEEGFAYDSSIFPIRHDLYGVPGGKRFPYQVETESGELTEFPPATVRLFGNTLPSAGGGYLRILPYQFTEWALRRLARDDGQVIVVYFHPWELDPEQPRIASRFKSRFRHYTNLTEMEPRLRRLMREHPFQPFRDLVTAPLTKVKAQTS
jgi:polysaccharide deacetylase family protein (PEP-CTERM system associated)